MTEQQDLWASSGPVPTDTDGRPLPQPRDPCAGKHGGNPASQEAFRKVVPHLRASHAAILAWLGRVGKGTRKQYADHCGKPLHSISGRFTELLAEKMIVETDDRPLDGSAFVRLA